MDDDKLFEIGKENFLITVDYGKSLSDMRKDVLRKVEWSGIIDLMGRTFAFDSGIRNFTCYYATLLEEVWLRKLQEKAQCAGIILADMKQLFAFGCKYMETEVTQKKLTPIIAADEGSTWLCSHDCLGEMVGFEWEYYHHAPGPKLHTISDVLTKGTRALAIRQ
ncbi:MAG TPA: hypothetical protein DDY52_02795 [Candidatus Moranbacteria bacterium]|nr:MAG: hypothetical protein UR51_C0014G0009 [Candidatus Moranbacteria bacterium GW2011_GWF1_34_10]HBI17051.1 hypothetical protein [Candidatus Moranbacteria bacterium]